MVKTFEVRVKLSKEELDKLKRKAQLMGLKPSTFMRMISLSAKIEVEAE